MDLSRYCQQSSVRHTMCRREMPCVRSWRAHFCGAAKLPIEGDSSLHRAQPILPVSVSVIDQLQYGNNCQTEDLPEASYRSKGI